MLPLVQRLVGEQALLDAFVGALEAEDQALLEGRFADLPAITRTKSGLITQLDAADAAREATLSALGFAPDLQGAGEAAQADAAVRQAWNDVLSRAQCARLLNLRVAAKVYTNLDFTKNALAFLRQRGHELYGPDGVHHRRSGGNTLAVG